MKNFFAFEGLDICSLRLWRISLNRESDLGERQNIKVKDVKKRTAIEVEGAECNRIHSDLDVQCTHHAIGIVTKKYTHKCTMLITTKSQDYKMHKISKAHKGLTKLCPSWQPKVSHSTEPDLQSNIDHNNVTWLQNQQMLDVANKWFDLYIDSDRIELSFPVVLQGLGCHPEKPGGGQEHRARQVWIRLLDLCP